MSSKQIEVCVPDLNERIRQQEEALERVSQEQTINTKVHSAVFTVDSRGGEFWGVAECRVAGDFQSAS